MDLLLDRSGGNTVFNQQGSADNCSEQFDDGTIFDENYVEIKVD